jgi:enoyl-CoA hydratase
VTLGLIPGFGGTVRLSRVVGLNRAREMTMTGEMMSASEALTCGLVNRVLPLVELLPAVLKTAETLTARGPIAIAKAKFMVLESHDLGVDAGMGLESSSFGNLFDYKDTQEGIQAFIEKRKPSFSGL